MMTTVSMVVVRTATIATPTTQPQQTSNRWLMVIYFVLGLLSFVTIILRCLTVRRGLSFTREQILLLVFLLGMFVVRGISFELGMQNNTVNPGSGASSCRDDIMSNTPLVMYLMVCSLLVYQVHKVIHRFQLELEPLTMAMDEEPVHDGPDGQTAASTQQTYVADPSPVPRRRRPIRAKRVRWTMRNLQQMKRAMIGFNLFMWPAFIISLALNCYSEKKWPGGLVATVLTFFTIVMALLFCWLAWQLFWRLRKAQQLLADASGRHIVVTRPPSSSHFSSLTNTPRVSVHSSSSASTVSMPATAENPASTPEAVEVTLPCDTTEARLWTVDATLTSSVPKKTHSVESALGSRRDCTGGTPSVPASHMGLLSSSHTVSNSLGASHGASNPGQVPSFVRDHGVTSSQASSDRHLCESSAPTPSRREIIVSVLSRSRSGMSWLPQGAASYDEGLATGPRTRQSHVSGSRYRLSDASSILTDMMPQVSAGQQQLAYVLRQGWKILWFASVCAGTLVFRAGFLVVITANFGNGDFEWSELEKVLYYIPGEVVPMTLLLCLYLAPVLQACRAGRRLGNSDANGEAAEGSEAGEERSVAESTPDGASVSLMASSTAASVTAP